jgi:hypothetical protein
MINCHAANVPACNPALEAGFFTRLLTMDPVLIRSGESIVLMTVSFAMAMPLVVALAMTVVAAVLTLVSRHVFIVVPVIAHEIDRPAAGVVLRAVFAPVFLVARRHVQVERRGREELRHLLDHHRLGINNWRLRNAADVDLSEESGLADSDRHANIAGKGRAADRAKTERRHEYWKESEKTRMPRHVDLLLAPPGP